MTPRPPAYRWVILFIAWLSFLLSFIDRLTWANVARSNYVGSTNFFNMLDAYRRRSEMHWVAHR